MTAIILRKNAKMMGLPGITPGSPAARATYASAQSVILNASSAIGSTSTEGKLQEGHSDKINVARTKRRRAANPTWRLTNKLRVRFIQAITFFGHRKSGSPVRHLGCSVAEFRKYLEGMFRDGMTWGNRGIIWELDHIVPWFLAAILLVTVWQCSAEMADKMRQQQTMENVK